MWHRSPNRDAKVISNMTKDSKVMINNFDAAQSILNNSTLSKMDFRTRLDMFFIDHDFVPLLVQQNYLDAIGDRRDM
jgi:hypothetical protein